MSKRTYALSVVEKAKAQVPEQAGNAYSAFRLGGVTGLSVAMMSVPTMVAHASGTNLLDGDVMTAITSGFGDIAVTCTQILAIATVTGISIVGMTAAAKYAMKKIKGALASAA